MWLTNPFPFTVTVKFSFMSGVNTHPSPQKWEGFGSGFLQGWSSRADTWETAPRQSLLLFYSLNPVCRVCDQPSRRCQSPMLLNLTSPGTHKLCLKQQWPTDPNRSLQKSCSCFPVQHPNCIFLHFPPASPPPVAEVGNFLYFTTAHVNIMKDFCQGLSC